jgi:hypothetical protein
MTLHSFFQTLINLVAGRPALYLNRRGNQFVLSARRRRKPISLESVLKKHESLSTLTNLRYDTAKTSAAIPIQNLNDVRLILQSAANDVLEVTIAPEIDCLQAGSVPCGFHIAYQWSESECCIRRSIDAGASYLGDGWFLNDRAYWKIPEIANEDDQWIIGEKLEGQMIIDLLAKALPNAQHRNAPLKSPLQYSQQPAIKIQISAVSDDEVTLTVYWEAVPSAIRSIPSLPGFVLCGETIRPGIEPQAMTPGATDQAVTLKLRGEEIPRFSTSVWLEARKFAEGGDDELSKRHPVFDTDGKLILSITRELKEGVGVATATPHYVAGKLCIQALELSHSLVDNTRFVRIDQGWLPRDNLEKAGIADFGRARDRKSLAPVTLSIPEILQRGSERLQGPWEIAQWPELCFPDEETPLGTARVHIELLRQWGMPGGIVGSIDGYGEVLFTTLLTILSDCPTARILIVGAKKTLDQLPDCWRTVIGHRFDGTSKDPEFKSSLNGLVLASPKAFETIPGLMTVSWTVLCLLEVDNLIKTGASKLFQSLLSCPRLLTLGLFTSRDFRNSQRQAIAQVFQLTSPGVAELVWQYAVRNPLFPAPELPSPYIGQPREPNPAFEAFNIGRRAQQHSVPIPPRSTPERVPRRASSLGIRLEVRVATPGAGFVLDARSFVNRKDTHAPFVPFMCYWPTYSSMTAPQRNWYFYWRDAVRHGQYPDTDLSYIFVHVYELIHQIGPRDAQDGYDQLHRLWTNYRDRFPKLNNYLPDWLADYTLVYSLPLDPLQPFVDTLSSGRVNYPDLLLSQRFGDRLATLPLPLLVCFSDYRINQGKFYAEGNAELVQQTVPKAIERLDNELQSQSSKGILAAYRPRSTTTVEREPFQSAVYEGSRQPVVLGTAYQYSQHPPLREFLTAVLKHIENRLRQRAQYRARLRGFTLEADIQKVLDEIILGTEATVSSERATVSIDVSRVQELMAESDSVREMLLANAAEVGPARSGVTPRRPPTPGLTEETTPIPRPAGTPAHLLTDLDPIYAVLSRLDVSQMLLLQTMMEHQWEIDGNILVGSISDVLLESAIEHINELSLEFVGDLLIASEGSRKVATEDYRDELDYLLRHYIPERRESKRPAVADLPSEWLELRVRLADCQIRALKVIAAGGDRTELTKIANENATMPELLVDSINELALDTIGDVIIEPGSEPPVVEDEDAENVRKMLYSSN